MIKSIKIDTVFPEIVYKQIGFVVDIHQTIINLSGAKGITTDLVMVMILMSAAHKW